MAIEVTQTEFVWIYLIFHAIYILLILGILKGIKVLYSKIKRKSNTKKKWGAFSSKNTNDKKHIHTPTSSTKTHHDTSDEFIFVNRKVNDEKYLELKPGGKNNGI